MHIKKLEISGFKSFVDKTVVHFDHDVIGIVGPNGCGKSNIVDAIRWCMGEQSAKHLRGKSMEDIIFNGSESRPQHGMAEVTLTFDNSDPQPLEEEPPTIEGMADGAAPINYRDYPEIAVTRRLYRDGTSEYLLNKTPVRLRDITDLFLGTGVGTKAYSIVEQGRIGQVVSSRPQDRRNYIEEAAGITKYRLRRKQAERKMQLTRQNLLRITDIVNEIDRTRSTLKRQAAKADRYVRYREELEDLFLHDASHRLLGMTVTRKVHAGSTEELKGKSSQAQAALEEREQGLHSARKEASTIEAEYDAATRESTQSAQKLSELKNVYERAEDRLKHINERLIAARAEYAELTERHQQLVKEKAEQAELIKQLDENASAQGDDTHQEDEQLATLKAKEEEAEKELTRLRNRGKEIAEELVALKTRKQSLQERKQETQLRQEKLQKDQELQKEQLLEKERAAAPLQEELKAATDNQQAAAERVESLQLELKELEPKLQSGRDQAEELANELNLKRSRLKVLEDLHQRLEGVGAGTKALLSSEDPAVLGLLADRVQVPERFTSALAGLLGDRLQCVIVDNPQRGLELLDSLRTERKGRATIASRSSTPVPPPDTGAEQDPAVIAALIDELGFAAEDAAVVRSLVGGALLVESAADALRVNEQYPGTTVVALDGTVVRDSGLVSGGSGDDVASAMVEQKREMEELREALALLTERESEAKSVRQELETQLTTGKQQLEDQRKSLHELELKRVAIENAGQHQKAELERLTEAVNKSELEIQEVKDRTGEYEAELNKDGDSEGELANAVAENQAQLEQAEKAAAEAKLQSANQATRVMERRVKLAQLKEQLGAAQAAAKRVEETEREGLQRLDRLDAEMTEAAETIGELGARLMLTMEARLEAHHCAERAQARQDEVRKLLDELRDGLEKREGELRELRVELAELDEQARTHEMALQKLEIELQHLLANVAERFRGLDLNRVVGDYHMRPPPDGEHRRRIDELTKLIDRMGPVNLDAREEHEEAERRFEELNGQKVDIEQSLSELERAIRHMDRESTRRFRETYDTINGLFKQTFQRLFKGGRAELRLTEPDNILETGVDIVAQPPGKKLGNIELMSGGEKALTATALIFAIFQHRPSPFCVLDEVDAPLDEANVGRYNEAIRAMTDRSQFIIITHIKKTMQSVDVLYGVTMGEPGVSRLVSVKVNDEAKARSSRSGSALEAGPREATGHDAATAGHGDSPEHHGAAVS